MYSLSQSSCLLLGPCPGPYGGPVWAAASCERHIPVPNAARNLTNAARNLAVEIRPELVGTELRAPASIVEHLEAARLAMEDEAGHPRDLLTGLVNSTS